MKTGWILISTLCAALGACQTTKDMNKEGKGTAIGAAAGGAAGAATGKGHTRTRNAVIGAAAGGVIGNRIGAYMDKQEAEMRDTVKGTGIEVKRDGDKIELQMPSDITFATGKSAIDPEFQKTLGDVADVLKKYDQTGIRIAGHTDDTGSAQFNQTLSQQRASSVAAFLRKDGVEEKRMTTEGFGESQPVASNGTPDGRAKNRRVQLELYPLAH